MKRILVAVCAACTLMALPALAQKQYKVANTVKLGGEGGWDYLTFDKDGQRLFITRGTHVMVVDPSSLQATGDIPNLAGVHGVALAPDFNRGFITNAGDNTVVVFDTKTLKQTDKIQVGQKPDAILYDPYNKRVYSFNGKSENASVIDAGTGKVVATIPLGGGPESSATDGKGSVYVNIEDKSEIVKIDANKATAVKHWSIKPCDEPSALAFDADSQRLFSGCHNKMAAVVNAETGAVVTTVPICEGVDAGAFNPNTKEAFMSCGDGSITAIHEDSPDKYSVKQTIPTAKGARTMALDPATGNIYTVTSQFGEKGPNDRRPPQVPGTFQVMVVKPE